VSDDPLKDAMGSENETPDREVDLEEFERGEKAKDVVDEEAEKAGAEAADIGGHTSGERMDPAERASAEHGGGEAEGFEQAEEQLRDEAENFDSGHNPAAAPQRAEGSKPDPDTYGEADHEKSTETDEDTQGTPADYDHSADN